MILSLDVETSIKNKGNPFTKGNKCLYIGIYDITNKKQYIYIKDNIYNSIQEIQSLVNSSSLLVGFNLKFDLHWLRQIGITWSIIKPIWDCQLGEFILNNQSTPYPSLDEALLKYGLPPKIPLIEQEYWSKGIDTEDVPEDLVAEYLSWDIRGTAEVYKRQEEALKGLQMRLFKLQCRDLLVLEEMEWNGLRFDTEKAELLAKEEEQLIQEVEQELRGGYESIPINFDSGDHLSCFLYGGTITEETREQIGTYKTGQKAGLPRYKLGEKKYTLPRLIKPIHGSELKKEGYFATNEPTLRQLKGSRYVMRKIELLLRRAESEKKLSTYYRGIPKLMEKMGWPTGNIHGQFNQVVAATSRLSSNKPNLQNFERGTKELLITRY